MSSLKKAAQAGQRIHRERHQPEARSKLGFLEKKQDYKLRADDINRKNRIIKNLHKKALNKNPDEFYFHMINSKLKGGMHHNIVKGEEHTPEQKQLMKSQDLKYVAMKRNMEAKKIAALKASLHILDEANQTTNSHIFFVDSPKEAKNLDVAKRLDTHDALLDNRINRLRMKDLETLKVETLDADSSRYADNLKKKQYAELTQRIKREKELAVIQQKLEMKRHVAASQNASVTLEKPATKTSGPVYKWKYERKR